MHFNDNDEKPRKRSFYSFSKNYPARHSDTIYAIGESRAMRKKAKVKKVLFSLSMVLLFLVSVVVFGVCLSLSNREIKSENKGLSSAFDGQFKTIHMPEDALTGGITFELFKTKLSQSSANAVLIDFKKSNGLLTYNSTFKTAIDLKASEKASENAQSTIALLKSMGYKIFAEINCYEDSLSASKLPQAAITEKDGVTIWLDDSAENDGNPWLNPYSANAENYLLGIIAESVQIGADAILLKSVTFPESNYAENLFCKGESESQISRNAILHNFVEKAAEKAGVPIAVYMNVDAALNGNTLAFSGSLFDSHASFNAVDFRKSVQKDGYAISDISYSQNSITDEILLKTALPIINQRLIANYITKDVIPVIDDEKYVSILEEMGINNYIIYDFAIKS